MVNTDARPGSLPRLLPAAEARERLLANLRQLAGDFTTATVSAIEQRYDWFRQLDAESRSWIGVVARAGIDGFVTWFSGQPFVPESVFAAAPRTMAGRITLQQTVELVRTTTEIVEEQAQRAVSAEQRHLVQLGVVSYSREVAFAAAAIYAKAAESRGAWDSRIEASIIDAVVRADTSEVVFSRASALHWDTEAPVVATVTGSVSEQRLFDLRRATRRLGLDLLAASQGERLICLLSGSSVTESADAVEIAAALEPHLPGTGPLVVGPVAAGMSGVASSVRAAVAGFRAAKAWPESPRTLSAQQLLPERVLIGDSLAVDHLVDEVFGRLRHSPELLSTMQAYFEHGCAVQTTARSLFVHPNTVRYRLARIEDLTGYSPLISRQAYVLRLAATLGQLRD